MCLTKDAVKEILSDDIGFSSREENKRLSVASVDVMKHVFSQYAFLGSDLILEANFHKAEIDDLKRLSGLHGFTLFLLFLQGETDELFARFTNRIRNEGRHPAHCTDDITDRDGFEKYLLANRKELSGFIRGKDALPNVCRIRAHGSNYDEVFRAAVRTVAGAR